MAQGVRVHASVADRLACGAEQVVDGVRPAGQQEVAGRVKRLPAELVQRHIATAEKARGKRMSARERRELKNDLAEQVLPRILPRSTNTDVLLCLGEGDRVLLFSTAVGARDTLQSLWLLAAAAFVLGVAMTIAVLCARGWL